MRLIYSMAAFRPQIDPHHFTPLCLRGDLLSVSSDGK